MSADMHTALRVMAAEEDMTISAAARQLLQAELGRLYPGLVDLPTEDVDEP